MVRAVRLEVLDAIIQGIPVRRLGEVSEIASIVSWLAGNESGFATGADFWGAVHCETGPSDHGAVFTKI
ncbi:NAD(P)-dependent dehydrogenase (short-subunit alcohol dehydrogenase family) [Paraburkholderia sp. WC7.3g]